MTSFTIRGEVKVNIQWTLYTLIYKIKNLLTTGVVQWRAFSSGSTRINPLWNRILTSNLLCITIFMVYEVRIKKKGFKNIQKMPKARQKDFFDLINELRMNGPIQKGWPNFSPLDVKKTKFHSHLDYRWVVCWKVLPEGILEIEVYYAGSRENAPY